MHIFMDGSPHPTALPDNTTNHNILISSKGFCNYLNKMNDNQATDINVQMISGCDRIRPVGRLKRGDSFDQEEPPMRHRLYPCADDLSKADWVDCPAFGASSKRVEMKSKTAKATKALDHRKIYLEVSPGVKEVLRGSSETKQAIEKNYFRSGMCWGCSKDLYCVADASFFICPSCKCFSPLLAEPTQQAFKLQQRPYGVGIAFTHDTLLEVQREQRWAK